MGIILSKESKVILQYSKTTKKPNKPSTRNIKDQDGTILTEEKDIMERCEQYCEELTNLNQKEEECNEIMSLDLEETDKKLIKREEITLAISKKNGKSFRPRQNYSMTGT